MTLATVNEQGLAWCCSIFYVYVPDSRELVFTSGIDTCHGAHLVKNAEVAASIVLESRVVARLQGVQIRGTVRGVPADSNYTRSFLKRFPYAAMSLKEMWVLSVDYAKYTDNTLGFGTKLIYEKLKLSKLIEE